MLFIAAQLAVSLLLTNQAARAEPTGSVHGEASAEPFSTSIAEAAARFGVASSWIRAVIRIESAGDAHARSPKGAMGLMQLMPETWATMRSEFDLGTDPYDPRDNILAGTAFLRRLYDRYGEASFLAAYNAGPQRYEDYLASGRPLPDETRAYVAMLAPLVGDPASADITTVIPVVRSWIDAPLFARRSNASSSRSAPSADPPGESGIVAVASADLTGLAPHSDGLFAPVGRLTRPQ